MAEMTRAQGSSVALAPVTYVPGGGVDAAPGEGGGGALWQPERAARIVPAVSAAVIVRRHAGETRRRRDANASVEGRGMYRILPSSRAG